MLGAGAMPRPPTCYRSRPTRTPVAYGCAWSVTARHPLALPLVLVIMTATIGRNRFGTSRSGLTRLSGYTFMDILPPLLDSRLRSDRGRREGTRWIFVSPSDPKWILVSGRGRIGGGTEECIRGTVGGGACIRGKNGGGFWVCIRERRSGVFVRKCRPHGLDVWMIGTGGWKVCMVVYMIGHRARRRETTHRRPSLSAHVVVGVGVAASLGEVGWWEIHLRCGKGGERMKSFPPLLICASQTST